MTTAPPPPVRCPCSSGLAYAECCGRYHSGAAVAPTAEALMRSRYSAFVRRDVAYLLATWHPSTRPARLELDDTRRWFGLEILGRTRGGLGDTTGTVDFRASYRDGGEPGSQRENSRFTRENGRWLYVDAA